MRVFAGDIVPKKKPDPAIYLLAAEELGVDASKYFDILLECYVEIGKPRVLFSSGSETCMM